MVGIVLALLKGLPYSGAVVLTRNRLDESNFFSAALVITITGNIILWSLALWFTMYACTALEWVLSFYALQYEMISVVTPLFQTGPLFVLFFAYLYLKELEHISSKVLISTILIVAGAMLVTIR